VELERFFASLRSGARSSAVVWRTIPIPFDPDNVRVSHPIAELGGNMTAEHPPKKSLAMCRSAPFGSRSRVPREDSPNRTVFGSCPVWREVKGRKRRDSERWIEGLMLGRRDRRKKGMEEKDRREVNRRGREENWDKRKGYGVKGAITGIRIDNGGDRKIDSKESREEETVAEKRKYHSIYSAKVAISSHALSR